MSSRSEYAPTVRSCLSGTDDNVPGYIDEQHGLKAGERGSAGFTSAASISALRSGKEGTDCTKQPGFRLVWGITPPTPTEALPMDGGEEP
jgi:hypothetical protein